MSTQPYAAPADAGGPPLLLVGVGRAGCAAAARIWRSSGGRIRTLLADTDARTGIENPGVPFLLMGANRLGGAGAGGSVANARAAAHESMYDFAERAGTPRLAVVTAGLGGGTGGGASMEILERLRRSGAVTLAFATMPFAFEGPAAAKAAMNARPLIERNADASVFPPMDGLVGCADSACMDEAFARGADAAAAGITLFWRLLETPGYISLDLERVRNLAADAGPAVFISATASGPDRAEKILAALSDSPAYGADGRPPKASKLVLGVMGGRDLRLAEVGGIAKGAAGIFGDPQEFAMGTVDDEDAFSGRISVAAFAFAAPTRERRDSRRRGRAAPDPLSPMHGHFGGAEGNLWNGEDIDVPTYIRRKLTLER